MLQWLSDFGKKGRILRYSSYSNLEMSWRHNESSLRGFKNIFLILSVAYYLPLLSVVNLRITHKTPRKLLSFINDGICFRSDFFTTLEWTLYLAPQTIFNFMNNLSQWGYPIPLISHELIHGQYKERDFGGKTQSSSPAGCGKRSTLLWFLLATNSGQDHQTEHEPALWLAAWRDGRLCIRDDTVEPSDQSKLCTSSLHYSTCLYC